MDKLELHSPDLTQRNLDALAALFPNVVTESRDDDGNLIRAVDFDRLRQELADHVVEGPQERYQLDWPGKRAAQFAANAPIAKTLRPERAESVDFDTTQNLFIEGDNLDALKLLQESYLGKVKLIYIDPPYNTGSDAFVYPDNYSENNADYLTRSGQINDAGDRLNTNIESNGRFHSDWLSMMYPLLKLARNLLTHDGLLFVSISDQEHANLRRLLDEILGEANFIGDIVWNSTKSVTNTALISVSHTHNLVYARDINYFVEHRSEFRLPDTGEGFSNPDNDPRGPWKADPFQVGGWRPNQQYDIKNPRTGEVYRPNPGASWKNDYNKYQELVADNRIVFGASGEAGPQRKRFLPEALERGRVTKTLWDDVSTTTNATQALKTLFGGRSPFDNPKPVDLIARMIDLGAGPSATVLDFFAGSSTTAHAVMQKNVEDGGYRRFIMVQLAEECAPDSAAFEMGFAIISEVSRERIRLAGARIKAEAGAAAATLDVGFRALRVDTTNRADVLRTPDQVTQAALPTFADSVKEGRSGEDLLFEVLLDWGLELTLPITRETVEGREVFIVDDGALIACFAERVTPAVVQAIARSQPLRAVFRDSGFASDAERINAEQIFRQVSPGTDIKAI